MPSDTTNTDTASVHEQNLQVRVPTNGDVNQQAFAGWVHELIVEHLRECVDGGWDVPYGDLDGITPADLAEVTVTT